MFARALRYALTPYKATTILIFRARATSLRFSRDAIEVRVDTCNTMREGGKKAHMLDLVVERRVGGAEELIAASVSTALEVAVRCEKVRK